MLPRVRTVDLDQRSGFGGVAASMEIDQVEASFEYRREFPNKTVPARGCKAGTVDGDSALGGASKARRLLRSKQIKQVPSVRYFAARCCVAPSSATRSSADSLAAGSTAGMNLSIAHRFRSDGNARKPKQHHRDRPAAQGVRRRRERREQRLRRPH